MTASILVVHTKPVEGREGEYDSWYTDVHLPEVLRIDGFVAARRYRLASGTAPDDLPYLAIYEVAEGALDRARAALAEALKESQAALKDGRTPPLAVSGALHADRIVSWYEPISSAGNSE